MASLTPIVVVFRPHQLPAWAEVHASREQLIDAWVDGHYNAKCSANADAYESPSWDDCLESLGEDLHALTVLESREEYEQYMRAPEHNAGIAAVRAAAIEAGWVSTRRIDVWHDTHSDSDTPVWCVSLCEEDGEEIRCLSSFPARDEAIDAGRAEANRRSLLAFERSSCGESTEI